MAYTSYGVIGKAKWNAGTESWRPIQNVADTKIVAGPTIEIVVCWIESRDQIFENRGAGRSRKFGQTPSKSMWAN